MEDHVLPVRARCGLDRRDCLAVQVRHAGRQRDVLKRAIPYQRRADDCRVRGVRNHSELLLERQFRLGDRVHVVHIGDGNHVASIQRHVCGRDRLLVGVLHRRVGRGRRSDRSAHRARHVRTRGVGLDVLGHVGIDAGDHADIALTIGRLHDGVGVQRGLRACEAPRVLRRQDGAALVLRDRQFVHSFRPLGEVGEGVDDVAGRSDPVRHILVQGMQVNIDLVGKLHHRRLDHAFGQIADFQGQVLRRELEIDALALVDRDGGLALHNILDVHGRAVANREVGRLADRDRVSDLVAVDVLGELVFIATENFLSHDQFVFEDAHRLHGDDIRGKRSVCHCNGPSGRSWRRWAGSSSDVPCVLD